MIGDPSGKTSDRQLLNLETINYNKACITSQLKKIINCEVVDNYHFYAEMSVIDYLRIIGKKMNVNHMLSKEMVKSRLESGISYTEFSYQILQAWDFKMLYDKYDVHVQGGGSDQWGNIVSGIELIDKFNDSEAPSQAAGITMNLLTNSLGQKFGKSVKGAIFLDENLTSVYEMYQFLFNQPDSEVISLLKALSFIELSEIEKIATKHHATPFKRYAQQVLADSVITDIHGKTKLIEAQNISHALFSGDISGINHYLLLKSLENNIPNFTILDNINIVELLITTKIAASKRIARELINNNGISINGQKITDVNYEVVVADSLNNGDFSLIKKGKRNWFLIKHSK